MTTIPYHKGYNADEKRNANKQWMRKHNKEKHINNVLGKDIVVWDGEGMKLSGADQPQHYVLFGCSARPDDPLIIDNSRGRLTFEEIAEYCLSVAVQYPNAIHLGYYFRYDQNMIIWSLPWPAKEAIYYKNGCVVRRGTVKYYVRMIPGKYIRITRIDDEDNKISILIEDFAAFFACSFVAAYEKLFKTPSDPVNWEIVKQGKADRAVMEYKDLGRVRRYWRAEILALLELAFEFRRIMFDADFYLREWHGPGALANYIRRTNDLIRHEWGGKEENLSDAVHEAIKSAMYGGHVERYRVGYVEGPIHSFDKNSAYPSAFCYIPTLEQGGEWVNTGPVDAERWRSDKELSTSFGVFEVKWRGQTTNPRHPLGNHIPQPLPHRDSRKNISFPSRTHGWYWAPEVNLAMKASGVSCEIVDGWVWKPNRDNVWPWESLFKRYYKRRKELKRNKNPTEMAFKLGLNSFYGKMAQRAGGTEAAPKSHTLCIAGYVTSTCRADVGKLIYSCPAGTVISVETDGVFTTTAPEDLTRPFTFGTGLGEWSHEVYDAMIILQNGVYFLRKDGKWLSPKSRGIKASALKNEDGETDPGPVLQHMSECGPDHRWAPIKFDGGEQFLGLGTAIARATRVIQHGPRKGKRSTNPFKAAALHCTWVPDGSEVDLEGRKSKRSHFPQHCATCREGITPDVDWHYMIVHSAADTDPRETRTTTYVLPWETADEVDEWNRVLMATEGIPEGKA